MGSALCDPWAQLCAAPSRAVRLHPVAACRPYDGFTTRFNPRQILGFPPWSHVRFGSEADMCSAQAHVRFTPESDIKCDSSFCGGQSAQRLGLNQKHQVANLQWFANLTFEFAI